MNRLSVLVLLLSMVAMNRLGADGLDLIDIFQMAQDSDPQYHQEQARRQSSGELKSQAIAVLLPTITATGRSSWNYLRNKKFSFQGQGIQRYWNHTGQVDVSQPIFNLDGWILMNQSEYQIARSEALLAKSFQDLMIRTVNAYFDVLLAQENLQFTQSELKARNKVLEQAKVRFEVGMAPITQVLEAEARLASSTAALAASEAELIDKKLALQEIIGSPLKQSLAPLVSRLELDYPQPADVEQWKLYAMNRNRELMAAMSDVKVAEKQIEHERAGHYPTINGVATYSFNDNNSTFGLRGETGAIGVEVNVPIFAGGGVSSRVRQAQHDYHVSQQSYEQTRRSIERSVAKAFFDVTSQINQVKAMRKSVASFDKTLETIETGMEVGSNTLVDVFDAQTDLFAAKRDLSQQTYAYLMSWLTLRQAAGLLVQDDIVQMNSYLQGVGEPEPSPDNPMTDGE
ncbi:MAG: TolC family outer membrane protein [Gammaproteobacteria bacterium]|nr:TolC family outer membrane protein [Gammaproteobacteria bacterium]